MQDFLKEGKEKAIKNIKVLSEKDAIKEIISEMGKIYLVSCGEFVKIGTTRDINKRISSIKTNNPKDIEVIFESQSMLNNYEVEKELHSIFSKYNVRGEWFYKYPILKELENIKDIIIKLSKSEITKKHIDSVIRKDYERNLLCIDLAWGIDANENNLNQVEEKFSKIDISNITDETILNDLKDYAEFNKELGEEEFEEANFLYRYTEKYGVNKENGELLSYVCLLIDSVDGYIFDYYDERMQKVIKYLMNKFEISPNGRIL